MRRVKAVYKGGVSILLGLSLAVLVLLPVMAGSTTKRLSTNFTLINLGSGPAEGVIQYFKPDGSKWRSDESFSITNPGGQAIFRQYFDTQLPDGQGSVIVSANQPLGAVVQILARNQTPTSGAYSGFPEGSAKFYVPLVIRNRMGASGLANSQIIVQNTSSSAIGFNIRLVRYDGDPTYTKTVASLAPGASYYYDLADESASNVPDGWYGSAVVETTTPGGQLAVVSNLFTGPHAMQTFKGFSSSAQEWLVPLFTSRLANGLSTPLSIQNVSGSTIPAGGIVITCTKNALSGGPTTINISNSQPIGDAASFFVNPVIDTTLPDNWYGSCRISASAGVVAFVQMRVIGTDRAAAYEAIPGGSTDKKVLVPLAAKRLANGFATVINIQNLSVSASAHVTFTYIPSPEYVAGGGLSTNIVITNVEIPAGGSIQHNLRLSGAAPPAVPALPDGWYGTCIVESADQPISGFVELTMLTGEGDTYQAHTVFTQP
ncbi:MAG: hypothetical protein QXT10_06370 [Candidatus Bathyarchaeia archaeon]|uniref:hypothetical protein n=1 Tax=Candidatus Hadarchaeum sp. TaxID=2883567 RepID=UPI00316BCD98